MSAERWSEAEADNTLDGRQRGFQARSVVGGIYVKLLPDASVWKKWRSRAGR